jgi:hypothetical protein
MSMKARMVLLLAAMVCAGEAGAHGGMADLSVYDRTEGRHLAAQEGTWRCIGTAAGHTSSANPATSTR